jgi:hypothetical protein
MKRRLLDALLRRLPITVDNELAAATILQRAVPDVEDLQIHALNEPKFREGAEVMREEILRILGARFDCGCHPAYHQLGVHAPRKTVAVRHV